MSIGKSDPHINKIDDLSSRAKNVGKDFSHPKTESLELRSIEQKK